MHSVLVMSANEKINQGNKVTFGYRAKMARDTTMWILGRGTFQPWGGTPVHCGNHRETSVAGTGAQGERERSEVWDNLEVQSPEPPGVVIKCKLYSAESFWVLYGEWTTDSKSDEGQK
jgi:hypothetical protein